MKLDICLYCEEMKVVKSRDEEDVCFDCALSQLEYEYKEILDDEVRGRRSVDMYDRAGFDAYDMLGDTASDYA